MISLNVIFAAGLFDSPWVIAAIVIIGAFINWLSQLRQQKRQQEEERRAREGETDSSQKPKGNFDVEEALRRLLGEELPKPTPAPPPILPRPPGTPPPIWQGRAVPPVIVAPPVVVALPVGREFELAKIQQQATSRLAQATELVRQHRVSGEGIRRGRRGQWSHLWGDRSSVRRAFVGSLVFGPPKGLES